MLLCALALREIIRYIAQNYYIGTIKIEEKRHVCKNQKEHAICLLFQAVTNVINAKVFLSVTF